MTGYELVTMIDVEHRMVSEIDRVLLWWSSPLVGELGNHIKTKEVLNWGNPRGLSR